MPFFKSHPETAGPANVFTTYPEIYRLWSEMSQELMNGPSPLSSGEREMIASFVVGTAGCKFAYVAHSEAAYAHGVKEGLIEELLDDIDTANIDDKLRPVFKFVKKLTMTPADMTQADADAVFDAGWDEKGLHDAIAITARMCFMQRIVEGHGFTPMTREFARENAEKRAKLGYVNLYPAFQKKD
ncbi:MAG: carboxymuconolactone decarboxylase family protein [Pseudomonadota bacterium]|nr:carboxymuconolactone decarboxylase family protein [Pseudomonadota bacterium]